MAEFELLNSLGAMILAATVCAWVLSAVRVPNIVGYIVAGLLLGPVTGWVEPTHAVELISEFGIILLLFLVGLELSIDKIRDIGTTAFVAAGVQMVGTAAGGMGLAWMLGLPPVEAVFVGIALMFSSTVIVIKLLEKRDDLDALYGRIAVGVLLVQDLVVVVVLTLVAGLDSPDALALADVATGLGTALLGMVMLGALVVAATQYVLPHALRWIAAAPDALFIWSLFWCFLMVLAAKALNLSPEIGAFLAGIALAQLPYHHELQRRVHPLMNFFIAVFFVLLGVEMEVAAALEAWPVALALGAFVMLVKPLLFFIVLPRLGHNEATSFRTGITLAQISEFGLILSALSLSAGLISPAVLSLITLVGLATFTLSAFLVMYNDRLYAWVQPYQPLALFGAVQEPPPEEAEPRSGHVIVVGINTLGRAIIDRMLERGVSVVAIDTDRAKLAALPPDVHRVHGDATDNEVLSHADFSTSRLVISALNIEEPNDLLAYRCRQAGVPCSIHAFDHSVEDDLADLDVEYPMDSKREGARAMINAIT